jgi:predicted ester cyclase
MSKEEDNKAVVGRWFSEFWGKTVNLGVIDEIAPPDMLLKYSLHEPRRGRDDIRAFMTDFRAAFPNLNFWGTADLIAEGDYVVGQWEGGGTHTGPAFKDFLIGGLPAATGRKMHFTGTTVLKVIDGKIVEEIGLDDGVTAGNDRNHSAAGMQHVRRAGGCEIFDTLDDAHGRVLHLRLDAILDGDQTIADVSSYLLFPCTCLVAYPVLGIARGRASLVWAARRMPAFGAPKPLYPRRSTISKKNRSSKACV